MGSKFIDMTGMTCGKLRVIGLSGERDRGGRLLWTCQCSCQGPNSVVAATGPKLRNGSVASCGCARKETKRAFAPDETPIGSTYGRWTVVDDGGQSDKFRHAKWVVRCECNPTETHSVAAYVIKSGRSTSCGCIKLERTLAPQYDWTVKAIQQGVWDRIFSPTRTLSEQIVGCAVDRKLDASGQKGRNPLKIWYALSGSNRGPSD